MPLAIANYYASPFHYFPLYVDVIGAFVAAVVLGVSEGALFGWLSAKIFGEWDRRRRWRLRREKYAAGAE
ncbi:MAG TPA: hypothetical protein VMP01_07715 [Pirellulaceae bacterium]|nr:hypothetical protein [Pirellulaceae bacterium]